MCEIVEDTRPAARYVYPWDFVPDMSAIRLRSCVLLRTRVHDQSDVNKLKRLANYGFIPEQVDKLLASASVCFAHPVQPVCGPDPCPVRLRT